MSQDKNGHPLGLHRVLDAKTVTPQNAQKLDVRPQVYANEISVDVEFLQIDSASFKQLRTQYPDEKSFVQAVFAIIGERGKMQNPVTGSGGMLLGTVREVGPDYPDKKIKAGDKIATLVSLTATPLSLQEISRIDFAKERIFVRGQAILFAKSLYAFIPTGVSTGAAIAAFDICGAPRLVVNHVKKGDVVFLMGLGKAGISTLAALRARFGKDVKILAIDASSQAVALAREWGARCESLDATDPLSVLNWVETESSGRLADVAVNLVNVGNTEVPAILSTRDGGQCIFFSMATNFGRATLGCESLAKDVELIMGRGYSAGHADFMCTLLKNDERLRAYFEKNFGE